MVVVLPLIGGFLLTGCTRPTTSYDATAQPTGPYPLFEGMGDHHLAITTSSPEAQAYFDQGLTWAYAFNHDEAIRSFQHATRLDPDCAMAYWGIALCHGPHINNPVVPEERGRAAWDALQQAQARMEKASPTERALIEALAHRYSDPPPTDRAALDRAYAEAMRQVYLPRQSDADVCTLYAESLMDLRPWDLWTKDGRPQPGTKELVSVLEHALKLAPDHPGANHLYVHTVESSPDPARGVASADKLRDLVPASGHLVHMPSHIDVLTGRWAQASIQNVKATAADRAYRELAGKQGFYRVYMVHNHHMLAFASMMEGRGEVAERVAREVFDSVPEDYRREHAALMDPYMGAIYDVHKRFGKWDAILAEPPPPKYLPITTAMWRFHRALAHAAKGDVEAARGQKEAFRALVAEIPKDATMAINQAHDILRIAEHMLDGEIEYRLGNIDASVAKLRQAIAFEDALKYMEPPEWIQPVRHTLGAVLVSDGRYAEAETIYREDLRKWPNNGWSLFGLARCLHATGQHEEAHAVDDRLAKAWSRADTPLTTSCLCVPKM
jgi:tetratricopeptide (TPR) repeat protein